MVSMEEIYFNMVDTTGGTWYDGMHFVRVRG
jgi:hypothetical protein